LWQKIVAPLGPIKKIKILRKILEYLIVASSKKPGTTLDGAKHISFSHENCEKLICFPPSKTGTWQWQKKLCTIRNKIPSTAKIATYKGVSINMEEPIRLPSPHLINFSVCLEYEKM
jgi:hypothetical protein